MGHKLKRLVALLCAVPFLMLFVNIRGVAEETPKKAIYFAQMNYSEYLESNQNSTLVDRQIQVNVADYSSSSNDIKTESKFEGQNNVVITGEKSNVMWKFNAEEAGYYNIEVTYFPLSGKGNPIEREILINSKLPFLESSDIVFQRMFENQSKPVVDAKGNEYRAPQIEKQVWMKEVLKDNQGYYTEPFCFYLQKGENTITFNSVSEPMAISNIRFFKADNLRSYKEVESTYQQKGYKDISDNEIIQVQGEDAKYKSDSTLYPVNDRSSYATSPQSVNNIKLNAIGGINWSNPRQKLTWEVKVPKTGLYVLKMRCKQNFSDYALTNRTLYIDGEIPFKEAKFIEIKYNNSWQYVTFGNDSPYKFYLTEGIHTVTLENTLGYVTDVLRDLQVSVNSLNNLVHKIRMVVGMFPDVNRDYSIETQIPECIEVFKNQSEVLKKAAELLKQKSMEKNSAYAILQKLYIQLDSFIEDSSTVPARLSSFETNISAVANYILLASKQPLLLDYMSFSGAGNNLMQQKESSFKNLQYEFLLFLNSFLSDYGIISKAEQKNKNISLWIGTGRDQALVLKSLIDNSFSGNSDIVVNMRLVNNTVLLPAVAAGKGPDVALGQEKTVPVNYGIRNAIYELNQFKDLDDVLKRFDKSSYISYGLNGTMYGLPETQTFLMMFYRKDILNELGLEIPQTWEELYNILFVLHKNYYDIGLPNITEDTIEQYLIFLYQNGGEFYNKNLSSTLVYSELGQKAFDSWVNLYTKYKITKKMDAFTRFRTGQAPLVIAPVTFYNQLVVSAPEIKGMWDIHPILGTKKADGTIDRSEVSGGTAAVIFKNTKDPQSSWEFLKWWTSAQTQVDYSKEMEILQGPSGRVPTANLEAFTKLSWTESTMKQINNQREFVKGLPEIPGSYIINRYLCTSARYSIETGGDSTEILFDWDKKINNEITKRRKEFKLD